VLHVLYKEIPDEGKQLKITDTSWFPEREVARSGELDVVVCLRRNDEKLLVRGTIWVTLVLICDRCLEEYLSPQKIDFQLFLEVLDPGNNVLELQDLECEFDPRQIEVLPFDGQTIDLADLLYQQMILAVPQKNLCRLDCCGICEHCGINRNLAKCACTAQLEFSQFDELRNLLKNNK